MDTRRSNLECKKDLSFPQWATVVTDSAFTQCGFHAHHEIAALLSRPKSLVRRTDSTKYF